MRCGNAQLLQNAGYRAAVGGNLQSLAVVVDPDHLNPVDGDFGDISVGLGGEGVFFPQLQPGLGEDSRRVGCICSMNQNPVPVGDDVGGLGEYGLGKKTCGQQQGQGYRAQPQKQSFFRRKEMLNGVHRRTSFFT